MNLSFKGMHTKNFEKFRPDWQIQPGLTKSGKSDKFSLQWLIQPTVSIQPRTIRMSNYGENDISKPKRQNRARIPNWPRTALPKWHITLKMRNQVQNDKFSPKLQIQPRTTNIAQSDYFKSGIQSKMSNLVQNNKLCHKWQFKLYRMTNSAQIGESSQNDKHILEWY